MFALITRMASGTGSRDHSFETGGSITPFLRSGLGLDVVTERLRPLDHDALPKQTRRCSISAQVDLGSEFVFDLRWRAPRRIHLPQALGRLIPGRAQRTEADVRHDRGHVVEDDLHLPAAEHGDGRFCAAIGHGCTPADSARGAA